MQRPPLVARALLHSMPVAPNAPPTPSAQVFPTLSASTIGSQTNIPATPAEPPRDRPVPSTSRTPRAIVNDSSDEDLALSYHMRNTSMPCESGWIMTPPGSPASRYSFEYNNPAPPLPPPPSYYSSPALADFGFAEPVQRFLLQLGTGPRALCKIDATLNFDARQWKTCFMAAGLSLDDARRLRHLIIQSLPLQTRQILRAAAHRQNHGVQPPRSLLSSPSISTTSIIVISDEDETDNSDFSITTDDLGGVSDV